jgi:hypothetical protein
MLDLLKSRRFQTAIVGLIVAVLVYLIPELEGQESAIGEIVAIIVLALLGSYTLDHATYNLGAGKVEAEVKAQSVREATWAAETRAYIAKEKARVDKERLFNENLKRQE